MRKTIINTNCGSDDTVVLMMMLRPGDISAEAITAVGGNIPLGFDIKNTLITIGAIGGQEPPSFVGAVKPLSRRLATVVNVYGKDGMGGAGPTRPTLFPEDEHTVDAIIRIVKSCPDEIELATIELATDVVLVIMKDPNTMKRIKQIYAMGTSGFDPGSCTPILEFNVYVNVRVFRIMIIAGIPVTIVGFDLCLGRSALTKTELDTLMSSGEKETMSAVICDRMMIDYNIITNGQYFLDFPDAVVVGVMLWDDIVLEKRPYYAYVCLKEEAVYG